MMRGDINTLWRMIRLLGQNAGLLSNALEVGKRPFVDDRWLAAPCLHPNVSSGSSLCENSDAELVRRISISISSLRKPIALVGVARRRQLRKQF
jgi:hypothetical protein